MTKRLTHDSILSIGNAHVIDQPTPINLSFFWGFGSLSGLMLAMQIITGIFLAIHYVPHLDFAFASVEHIIRDVQNGWLLRYLHANGASFFFVVVYIHVLRGLYYGSYLQPRAHLWCSGVLILILIIATGFIGYVLPIGQISLWGATVITNLFSAIPGVGPSFVEWLWGGFAVDQATLNRFFSLHYLLPFLITGLVFVHLLLLHQHGSNNPIGIDSAVDRIPFYPYFQVKDLLGLTILITLFFIFIFFAPNLLGHPDNYITADPMITPAHIVPEWYFLVFYAILRSIPHKLGGVVAIGAALVSLFFLPMIAGSEVRSSTFRPIFRKLYWIFVANCLILGWIGQISVESPFVEIGQIATAYYFFFLLVIIPCSGEIESKIIR